MKLAANASKTFIGEKSGKAANASINKKEIYLLLQRVDRMLPALQMPSSDTQLIKDMRDMIKTQ